MGEREGGREDHDVRMDEVTVSSFLSELTRRVVMVL